MKSCIPSLECCWANSHCKIWQSSLKLLGHLLYTMCLPDLLCGLGFGALTVCCFKLHRSDFKKTKNRVSPGDMTPYEMQIHCAHMRLYQPKSWVYKSSKSGSSFSSLYAASTTSWIRSHRVGSNNAALNENHIAGSLRRINTPPRPMPYMIAVQMSKAHVINFMVIHTRNCLFL